MATQAATETATTTPDERKTRATAKAGRKAARRNGATHESATTRLTPTRTAKPRHPCICGCGSETRRVFAQGHDAKVYAILRKIRAGEAKPEAVPKGVRDDPTLLAHMVATAKAVAA